MLSLIVIGVIWSLACFFLGAAVFSAEFRERAAGLIRSMRLKLKLNKGRKQASDWWEDPPSPPASPPARPQKQRRKRTRARKHVKTAA